MLMLSLLLAMEARAEMVYDKPTVSVHRHIEVEITPYVIEDKPEQKKLISTTYLYSDGSKTVTTEGETDVRSK